MLQGVEERHQCRVPVPSGAGRRRLARHVVRTGLESPSLHGQIDFSVAVRRLERDMAQPRPDCIDVDPGAQQVHCGCVPQGMGLMEISPLAP